MIKDWKGDTAEEIGTGAPHPRPKIVKGTRRANANTEKEAKAAKENEATQETKSVSLYL